MKLYKFKGKNVIYSSLERIKEAKSKYEHRKNLPIIELIVLEVNNNYKEPA